VITATAFKRGQILEALLLRLQGILTINGYATDAGLSVHLGRVDVDQFSPFVASGIVCVEAGEETMPEGIRGHGTPAGEIEWILPVQLAGTIAADLTNPLAPAEALLGDMDRAIFGEPDLTLGGLLDVDEGLRYGTGPRVTSREPGSPYVVAEFGLEIRYVVASGNAEAEA
jgi:hypothetical protein